MKSEEKHKLTIRRICSHPSHFDGREVTLRGVFRGWTGLAHFPAGAATISPVSRSDWLISTGADYAYVTGGLIEHMNPAKPDDQGCRIEITARVARAEDGGVYFVFLKGRQLAKKPAPREKHAA